MNENKLNVKFVSPIDILNKNLQSFTSLLGQVKDKDLREKYAFSYFDNLYDVCNEVHRIKTPKDKWIEIQKTMVLNYISENEKSFNVFRKKFG